MPKTLQMTHQVPVLIDREEINTLTFPMNEIQMTLVKKSKISSLLNTSAILGKRYQDKVKITFSDSVGVKTVETTVWEVAVDKIILKGGIKLPFHRVTEVELNF